MSRSPSRFLTTFLATLLLAPMAGAQFSLNLGLGAEGDSFEADVDPVTLDARVDAATGNNPAKLVLTAKIEPGWHVYSITQPPGGPQRTTIELDPSDRYQLAGEFAASTAYETHTEEVWPGVEIQEHADEVTWSAPLEIAAGGSVETIPVSGTVRLQACKEACLPLDLPFTVNATAAAAAASTDAVTPAPITDGGYDLSKVRFGEENTFGYIIVMAMLGGLALNLMPCVLPVIGLKVMSFVSQAGKSRVQAFALNVWYALGILAVFWVLAVLAITVGYSWGDQAGSPMFNVIMATLVLAMGLSLLGVWEIPIPGFLGSNTTQVAASQEGAFGAWLKGVVTTLLAIPCTGPGMALALGWAVDKSAPTVAMIFTAIGLGMASPYLLIGAFPGLVKFLPKPGAWMESFKQLMGFVLLATVVFLISLLPPEYVVPTLALLTATGLACWVYAGTPITASPADKWQSYALCGAILLGGGVLSFGWLLPDVVRPRIEYQIATAADARVAELLAANTGNAGESASGFDATQLLTTAQPVAVDGDWGPFSLTSLGDLAVERGKTVLVDFGAEWCLTCKTLEQTVLHTDAVEQAIERADVATLYADYTDYPAEIKATLASLRSQSVPVVAIFPGDDPYRPIVFRGGYTQGQLIEAIATAAGEPVEKIAAK